jgi:hypothetical protein
MKYQISNKGAMLRTTNKARHFEASTEAARAKGLHRNRRRS